MRTSQAFVNWFSIIYFAIALATLIFLWFYTPVIDSLFSNLLHFAFYAFYIVAAAILWPGYWLAVLCFGM